MIKNKRQLSHLHFHPFVGLGIALFIVSVTILITILVVRAYASSLAVITGCIKVNNGTVYNMQIGNTPLAPCHPGDSQITVSNGTITSVTAGTGLTGGGITGDITLGVANNGINTGLLADGSVTPDKISNDATESSRVQTWVDSTESVYNVGALGSSNTILLNTGITVTVPAGKAYYYTVEYDGQFYYSFSERANGSPGLNASWTAHLFSDSTEVAVPIYVVQTGFREDWNALTNGNWIVPYHASWLVRLGEGTHSLKVLFGGYSDNTMNMGHIRLQRMQVLRNL